MLLLSLKPCLLERRRNEVIHPSLLQDPARRSPVPAADKDLKNLDDTWAERFARLEAMLLSKSGGTGGEASRSHLQSEAIFDPGASISKLAESAEPSSPSLVQATGDAIPPRGDEI